jgi:pimeloyl-ACP methyl ester carboxylesterase
MGAYYFFQKEPVMKSKKELVAADGIKLAYDFYAAENPKGWLVLIHMMPAVKESWQEFAGRMQKEGFASIAFDLRGHGRSQGGPDGYLNFSDREHQMSIKDLEAAARFMKEQGAAADRTYFIGASIGANLAIQYAAEHPELKKAALLSPGLNYRGILTLPLVEKIQPGQRLLFVSSLNDGENTKENQKLAGRVPAGILRDLIIYKKAGHGTEILNASRLEEFDLTAVIGKFLQDQPYQEPENVGDNPA